MGALSWPDPLPVHGPVRLRPFAAADLDLVAELADDPYIPLIGTVPSTFTPAAGLAYLARQHQRLAEGAGWSFAIADRTTDHAVGGAGLWLHPGEAATAGYGVARAYRGHGYAAAALQALTAFARTVPVGRIELFIEPGNAASIAVAARCGYADSGLWSRHTEIGGEYRDMLRFVAELSR
jgi:[ribosomal protein S5]-alanine N-acetyltransferase